MNGRAMVKLSLGLALVFGMLFGGAEAEAQTGSLTQNVERCIDSAADELKSCVDDLPWYAEALCYARYASDGVLCAPTIVLKAA